MKLKLIAAASCLALSSIANAAIDPGSDLGQPVERGGELIFSVWDSGASTSYTLDLGIDTREFNGETGYYEYDLSADENWAAFTATASYDNMAWDVAGSDRATGMPSLNGVMTTARVGQDASVTGVQHGLYNTLQMSVELYQQELDGTTDTDYGTDKSYFLSGGDYAGSTGTWGSFKGNVTFSTASYGDTMEFWNLTTGLIPGRRPSPSAEHAKLAGTWTLADNKLVYTAVPVPAAVWLFGSALAGLVGVSRRKRS